MLIVEEMVFVENDSRPAIAMGHTNGSSHSLQTFSGSRDH